MNLTPSTDRIIVKPDTQEEMTKGGLYIPDSAKERPQTGTVLAVGEGRWDYGTFITPKAKVGDRILYSKYGGTDITHEGEDLIVIRETEIFAYLPPAEVVLPFEAEQNR